MSEDLNEKIQAILSDPSAMQMTSSMANNGFSDNMANDDSENDEFVSRIQNTMNTLKSGSDKRVNLLNALKPYMRESRASGIDKAIKLLRLTQLGSVFKDL